MTFRTLRGGLRGGLRLTTGPFKRGLKGGYLKVTLRGGLRGGLKVTLREGLREGTLRSP